MTGIKPLLFLVVTALGCGAFARPAKAAVRTLVAIGNDVGLSNEVPLRWAEHDARRFVDVFTELGGVTQSRATLLLGEGPRALERTLLEVKGQVAETKRRGERAEVVVTYSGHGDAESLHMKSEVLSVEALTQWVDAIGADATVVILDACRTGPVRAGSARGFGQAPAFDVTLVQSPAPKGRVVFKSASEGEVAQESDDLEGAFFTHHLLAGLRGAADVDQDAAITLQELWRYAHGRTVDQSFGRQAVQHPEAEVKLAGQSDLVLTRTDIAAASLSLAPSLSGSFLVVDERTTRVLFEVQKAEGEGLTLAVPPRRLRVQWRQGSTFGVADVGARRGAAIALDADSFSLLPRLAGLARGARVDPTPWGATLGLVATTPPSFGGGSAGLVARGERRLWTTPFAIEVLARATYARAETERRTFDEVDGAVVAGVGVEYWTLVGRLNASVLVGVHGVGQRAVRTDLERLGQAQIIVADSERLGATFGPISMVRAGIFAPIFGPLGVEAGALGSARLLRKDGVDTFGFDAGVYAGAAVEF